MMRHLLLAALALVFSFSPLRAQQSPSTILILDASGSMWGTVDGQTKISAARKAVGTILAKWKPADKLGLMVYGHRSKSDCNDIELMIPVGPVDAAQINAAVKSLNPKGKTPITDSLRQAAAALGAEKNPATVILVSDGIETCKGDP
jgi:Ca-activated chloride channel family protein